MIPRSLALALLGSAVAGTPASAAALRPEPPRPEPPRPEPVETAQSAFRTPSAAHTETNAQTHTETHTETRRALLLRSDDPIRSRTAREPAADSRTTLILGLLALSAAASGIAAGYTRLLLPAKAREKGRPVSDTRS